MSGPARRARAWSLQRRLVLGIVALLAIVSVVVGAVSAIALRENLLSRLDEQVRVTAGLGDGPGGGPGGGADGGGDSGSDSGDGPQRRIGTLLLVASGSAVTSVTTAEYVGEDGVVVALTADQAQRLLDLRLTGDRLASVDLGGDLGSFRVTGRSEPSGRIVVSGLSLDDVTTTTTNLVLIFALVALLALVIAAVAGTVVVRLALRPLGRVAATATRVSELPLASGEVALAERVPESDTDPRTEVGQVGGALNRMLGHVEQALVSRQESEDRLKRFVADASHELRTPLASIRGYAELSRGVPEELPPDVQRSLERIGSESVRMTSLVEDLLLLARLDSGAELRREPVDLGRLLVDAVGDAHVAGPDHRWVLELPEDDPEVLVTGDPDRLHQVLANLLANARTHTPSGTVVTASVSRADRGAVIVEVADDGPGIPAELQPRLFGRFVRGDDSRSRVAGSSGLGLSIAQAITVSHGGSITVESSPGRTVFRVTIPGTAATAR